MNPQTNFPNVPPQYPPPTKKRLSSAALTIIIIVGVLCGSCIVCTLIGGLTEVLKPKTKTETQPETTSKTNVVSPTASPSQTRPRTESSKNTIRVNPTPKASEQSAGVTMANFNRLETGMTYSQVVEILGKEGEELSSNDIAGYKTVMYKWDGEAGWGSNMNVMFQNGKLISKSQFGLK